MDTTESSLLEAWGAKQSEDSAGTLEVASREAAEAAVARAESDTQADEAWRATGLTIPYDYRGAYAAGTDLTKELPNKHLTVKPVNVAGYNLATGKKHFDAVPTDVGGAIKEANDRLSKSKQQPGKPPPHEDVTALSNIAQAFARHGRSYADFDRAVPTTHDPDQRRRAWKAGVDAVNMQSLHGHFEKLNRAPVEVKPADVTFEETMANPKFAAAARILHKANWGTDIGGSDLDAAKWLSDHLRWLDWNTVAQAAIITKVKNADAATLKAYTEALDIWDKTAMEKSWLAQLGNVGRGLIDPLNLAGAGVGKATVMTAGRVAVRAVIGRMSVGAAGGAVAGAAGEVARAQVQGKTPEAGDVALGAAGGLVAGATFSAAVPELVDAGKLVLSKVAKNIAGAQSAPSMGGRRAQMGAINPQSAQDQLPFTLPEAFDPKTGFYSGVARAVASLPDEPLTPEQAIAHIKKAKDVRKDELDFIGLEERFSGQDKVTKNELIDYVESVRPRISEEVIEVTGPTGREWLMQQSPRYLFLSDELAATTFELNTLQARISRRGSLEGDDARLRALEDEADSWRAEMAEIESRSFEDVGDLTRSLQGGQHGNYTVGRYGEQPESNYREVLYYHKGGAGVVGAEAHFGERAGIVSWLRTTDRRRVIGGTAKDVETTGESVRFIEEAQSDAHANRRVAEKTWKKAHPNDPRSYDQMVWEEYKEYQLGQVRLAGGELPRGKAIVELLATLPEQWADVTPRQRRAFLADKMFWGDASMGGESDVQPMEVMKNWPASTIRSALFDAAKAGKDWLAWTPGEVHRKRWGKEGVVWAPGSVTIQMTSSGAYVHWGAENSIRRPSQVVSFPIEELVEFLEKLEPNLDAESLQRVLSVRKLLTEHSARAVTPANNVALQNLVLAKEFEARKPGFKSYDTEMVNEANKFLKRYGSKVEQIKVNESSENDSAQVAWGIRLTPQLRERIMKGGVPLAVAGFGAALNKEEENAETD